MAIQWAALLIQVLIAFAVQVIGYLLVGKPKTEKTDDVRDFEAPTAESGRPIPVVFGEVEIKGVNILWHGEKSTYNFEINA